MPELTLLHYVAGTFGGLAIVAFVAVEFTRWRAKNPEPLITRNTVWLFVHGLLLGGVLGVLEATKIAFVFALTLAALAARVLFRVLIDRPVRVAPQKIVPHSYRGFTMTDEDPEAMPPEPGRRLG